MVKRIVKLLLLAVLLLVIVPGQTRVYGYTFQAPVKAENMSSVDTLPAALQASDGTIWLAWESFKTRTDVYYQRMRTDGTIVTPIQILTDSSTGFNRAPTLAQLQNGTIFLAWAGNVTGLFKIYAKTYNGTVWTQPSQVTFGSGDDQVPKFTVAQDGTLWLVWERDLSFSSRQVFYKTLRGNVWSGDTQLTTDLTLNTLPNVATIKGGSIWVSWSKFQPSGSSYNIFYQTFNGTTWSSQIALTVINLSTFGDTHPDIVQDRNGTIWAFFSREMKLTTNIFQDKLWYKFSGNAGLTWSADAQLTFGGNANNTIDDEEPIAIQAVDKSLWIFYSSDATGIGSLFDIYYIKTNAIWPVHDLAVTKIQVSPLMIRTWETSNISVTVTDLGDFPDNAQLTVQAVNKTVFTVGTASHFLAATISLVFNFTWTPNSAPPGRYTIVASVTPPPGETIGASLDGTLRFRSLGVLYLGDVNRDGCVNIVDAAIMAVAYGSTPSSPNWNPAADVNRDGVVNIIDFAILGNSYGKCI
jgi:hypothetical protein